MLEPLVAADLSFWGLDSPTSRQVIGAYARLDRAPDRETIVARLASATEAHPRMKQRLAAGAKPAWVGDDRFSIERHLEWHSVAVEATSGSDTELRAAAAQRFSLGFDFDRPPWFLAIFVGNDSKTFGLLFCVHHAFADGISGLGLFYSLTDSMLGERGRSSDVSPAHTAADQPSSETSDSSSVGSSSSIAAIRSTRFKVGSRAQHARALLGEVFSWPVSSGLNGRNSNVRRFDFLDLALPELTNLRRRYRVSLNELLLALVADAVESYERDLGRAPKNVITLIPVNLREHRDISALGNDLTAVRFPLPVTTPGLRAKAEQVQQTLSGLNEAQAIGAYRALSQWLTTLPRFLRTLALRFAAARVNLICTNVPGPRNQRSLGGAKLFETYGLPALMRGQGVAFAFIRERKNVSVALVSDPAIVAEPNRLLAQFEQAFTSAVAEISNERATQNTISENATTGIAEPQVAKLAAGQ